MKKQTVKKRNASDITLRNLRATKIREAGVHRLLQALANQYVVLENRLDALEQKSEAWSRQPERVERDNIEGGPTPLPETASTPETRRD
jgi:hypothetical protein